jgi:hypothetical protein
MCPTATRRGAAPWTTTEKLSQQPRCVEHACAGYIHNHTPAAAARM